MQDGVHQEDYVEVPLELLERKWEDPWARSQRWWRYAFGIVLVASIGLLAYLARSERFAGSREISEAELRQLIAQVEDGGADSRGASSVYAASDSDEVDLYITTTPDGADVSIDATQIGATPVEHRLRRGAYVVSVSKPGYELLDTVLVLLQGGRRDVAIELRASSEEGLPEILPVSEGSEEPSAEPPAPEERTGSALNREERPDETRQAESAGGESRGAERVPAAPAGEPPARTNPAPEEDPEDVAPPERAGIVLSSHPAGAQAFLDDRLLGRTPLSVEVDVSGRREIRLELDSYEPLRQEIFAARGATTTLHGELVRQTGTLRVRARPWGTIYVDGVLHQPNTDVWYETELPSGEHTVLAVHPALGSTSRTVDVKASETTTVVLDLDGGN